MIIDHEAHRAISAELSIPVLQAGKKQYATAVDYWTNRLFNRFLLYDAMVSGYIAEVNKKVELQSKACFSSSKELILITVFLATFKIVCDTNNIYEAAAKWVLPHFVYKPPANAPNSRLYAENSLAPFIVSVHNQEQRCGKLLRPYTEALNYLFKKLAMDQAVAERDHSILRYIQPPSISLQQYADGTIAKSCEVAEMYGERTIASVFIEAVCSLV